MEKGLKKFLCDRTFMKAVLAAAIPLMLQQLISSSVNLVDNLMVGQLGDAALSSVAAVNRYYMIALFGTNGLAAAASVFIAQYYGAGEQEHMKQTFRTLLVIACVIMTGFTLAGLLLSSGILGFFTSDATVTIDYGDGTPAAEIPVTGVAAGTGLNHVFNSYTFATLLLSFV